MLTIQEVLCTKNTEDALSWLMARPNSMGIDGIKLHDVPEWLKTHAVIDCCNI